MILNNPILKARFTEEQIYELVDKHFPYDNYQGEQRRAIFEAVRALTHDKKRHVLIDAPTGVGKSAIAVTIHKVLEDMVYLTNTSPNPMFSWRTTICTVTKSLQDQYCKDYPEISDLRGKLNYPCHHDAGYFGSAKCSIIVSSGSCKHRVECPYVKARDHWLYFAPLRVTNSSLAIDMPISLCGEETSRTPLLIIDECHKTRQTVLDHTIMEFSLSELLKFQKFKLPGSDELVDKTTELLNNIFNWMNNGGAIGKMWHPDHEFMTIAGCLRDLSHDISVELGDILKKLLKEVDVNHAMVEKLHNCVNFLTQLKTYCDVCIRTDASDFIMHDFQKTFKPDGSIDQYFIRLKPIIVKDVIDIALFNKHDYFIHMSATVCGATAYLRELGISDEESHVVTLDNPIPKENRKIFYMPVGKMNAKEQNQTLPKIVDGIIELSEQYKNQCGLIHVSSYKLCDDILAKMPNHMRAKMIIGRDKRETIMELRRANNDGRQLIVISPSMKEGVDLKGDLCRFMIIAKVPFGNLGDPVIKYICDRIPVTYTRETVLDVVQSTGRGVRGITDYADTYILDGSFDTIIKNGWNLIPDWWKETFVQY